MMRTRDDPMLPCLPAERKICSRVAINLALCLARLEKILSLIDGSADPLLDGIKSGYGSFGGRGRF